MSLLIRNARVLTLAAGARPRRGAALRELGVIPRGDVLIEGGLIARVGASPIGASAERAIDAGGRVLMPGFVDGHTHACWAGDRLDEWERGLRGESYSEILQGGGGIMSTVRAVRGATDSGLAAGLRGRLHAMLNGGTTTVEVKSGYGLTARDELKMLGAIGGCGRDAGGPGVVGTALLGHAIDPEDPGFVERTIGETLDAVHAAYPGAAIDVYCERSAWTLGDAVRLLERARALGHPVRAHADQFTSTGLIAEAVRLGAVSVDHLEASTPEDLERLADSGTFGVVLPCSGFHLDGRYADGRRFIDAGGAIALATNCNPGSAPTTSMAFAAALAVRFCGLTPGEAIAACTVNAADLLGLSDRGVIEPGRRADLVLLRHADERMLTFEVGENPATAVVLGGRLVRGA